MAAFFPNASPFLPGSNCSIEESIRAFSYQSSGAFISLPGTASSVPGMISSFGASRGWINIPRGDIRMKRIRGAPSVVYFAFSPFAPASLRKRAVQRLPTSAEGRKKKGRAGASTGTRSLQLKPSLEEKKRRRIFPADPLLPGKNDLRADDERSISAPCIAISFFAESMTMLVPG